MSNERDKFHVPGCKPPCGFADVGNNHRYRRYCDAGAVGEIELHPVGRGYPAIPGYWIAACWIRVIDLRSKLENAP